MTSMRMKRIRFGLVLLAGGSLSGAALAQSLPYGAGQYREDPGEALSRNLKALGDSPRSLTALMGAGKAALELGDPQAAITFFARAEEIAPRDGRIKAGFGSAFLMMEQPEPAMKFFGEAAALGAPESEFAHDRGLAYDLLGDSRRAQADYAVALRRGEDPEVRRRLALSLANSGDRNGALAAIDGQLRQQDRAAWRTRAFVLALAGDSAEAARTMQSVMPSHVAAMQPFFARLPSLSPAQRAMAVHYGHFPSEGSPVQMAQAPIVTPAPSSYNYRPTPAPTPAPAPSAAARVIAPVTAPTAAGRPDSGQSALGRTGAPPVRVAERRLGRTDSFDRFDSLTRTSRPLPAPRATRQSPPVPNNPSAFAQGQSRQATQSAQAAQSGQSAQAAPVQVPLPRPVQQQPNAIAVSPNPGFAGVGIASSAQIAGSSNATPAPAVTIGGTQQIATNQMPQVQGLPSSSSVAQVQAPIAAAPSATLQPPVLTQSSPQVVAVTPTPKPAGGLAAVVAAVNALSDPAPAKPEPAPAAKPKVALAEVKPPASKAAAERGAKPIAEKKSEPAKTDTGRYWVQIASAPDRLVASEFNRLKAKVPKLLADKSGWSSPLGATNRVLIGPFKSSTEAQELVNQLAKSDITSFSWTSPAGQEIAKLAAK